MTSTFATNAVFKSLKKQRWLEVDDEGKPLQGQVPLTYQVYSGQGNETIVYDGSNCLVIENALTSGELTVDLSQMHNWFGRRLDLVIRSQLANNLVMDYGAGTILVPGVPIPLNSTTTPAGFGPVVGVIDFFAIDQAVLVKSPVTIPTTIIPGNDGQFLGTVGGTVEWADLPSTKPKTMCIPWFVDPSNELNGPTKAEIVWNPSYGGSQNDTDLTITTNSIFTVVTPTKYTISVDLYVSGNLDVSLGYGILIDGSPIVATTTSLGLVGQSASLSITRDLDVGQEISIVSENISGPDSGTRSITPAREIDGYLNIIQYS